MINKVIYPELSFKIVGIVYNVYNELGYGYQEKYYQKALEIKLMDEHIAFKRELKTDLKFNNQKIGHYYLDFLIDDKIILEIKVGQFFHKKDYEQIRAYLKANNLELGILTLFSKDNVKTKRVLNKICRD